MRKPDFRVSNTKCTKEVCRVKILLDWLGQAFTERGIEQFTDLLRGQFGKPALFFAQFPLFLPKLALLRAELALQFPEPALLNSSLGLSLGCLCLQFGQLPLKLAYLPL